MLDLALGRYPGFLFGTGVGSRLPVFHFHETSPDYLAPRLQYLAENGYRTVTSEAIAALALRGVHPGPRAVALCFDDAWASLWTVAAPLLARFGFSAITYAIPGRVVDAVATRPTLATGHPTAGEEDRSDVPFVTWPELRALAGSGTIDVQSHTWSHSAVFSGDDVIGYVTQQSLDGARLERPRLHAHGLRFAGPGDLGAPLFATRSRMSDGYRFLEDASARDRCVAHVHRHGGAAFFDRPGWRDELRHALGNPRGRFESDEERETAITEELERGRSELNARLGVDVHQVCLPWGVGGQLAQRIARRLGFTTMFCDRVFGRRTIVAGDDPFTLMRLHDRFIFCLPGRGRRLFFIVA